MGTYDYIYRTWVFPYRDRRRGFFDVCKTLENELIAVGENARAHQWKSLQAICKHAAKSSPYWRDVFGEVGISAQKDFSLEEFLRVPILEKSTIRDRLEEVSSSSVLPKDRVLSQTGGSTAAPTRFYADRCCQRKRGALRWLYWKWIGRTFYSRWGKVWGAASDLGGKIGSNRQRAKDRLFDRCLVLHSNRMSQKEMREFLRGLQSFKAEFLHGYGQAIHRLAEMIVDSPDLRPSLRGITYAAEPVSKSQRRVIEDAFKAPVFSHYGTREFGTIGAELPDSTQLHVVPSSVFVEIVNEKQEPVPPGEVGRIIVTDLWNQATGFIRYRIGDLGRILPDVTLNGLEFQRIELIGGRETDFIVVENGQLVSGALLTTFQTPGVAEIQYRQSTLGEIEIHYVPTREFDNSSIEIIGNQIAKRISPKLKIRWIERSEIHNLQSGKTLVVVCTLAKNLDKLQDPLNEK
jgi:phenylacetate-CoA ligase